MVRNTAAVVRKEVVGIPPLDASEHNINFIGLRERIVRAY
jgi:hypothetical protein